MKELDACKKAPQASQRCLALRWALLTLGVATIGIPAPTAAQETYLEFYGGPGWFLRRARPIGDIDLDGVTDLVLGAVGAWAVPGMIQGGAVLVVSGADGHRIHPTIFGPNDYGFGFYVTGVGDFDGDGIPDFASGVPDDGPGFFDGEVRVWSGRTAELLAWIPAPFGNGLSFGHGVFELGDLNGDGYGELAATFDDESDIYIYGGPNAWVFRIHPGGAPLGGAGTP